MQKSKIFILSSIVIVFLSLTSCTQPWEIHNPYQSVNWSEDGQYKANFHTHTTLSDGFLNPQTVIDKYHSLGYSVLAITDHNTVTWPWTGLSNLEPSLRRQNELVNNPENMPENLIFEDRDPDALGMIAIQANELSRHNDMGSFFNDFNEAPFDTPVDNAMTEQESLDVIRSKNGIAMLYHPGRYNNNTEWYTELYLNNDHLIGLEILNQGDRYPADRALWDSVLSITMPERPVWGFSNDDMHRERNLGFNWNIMILPELTLDWVKKGMENGLSYYVYAPSGHNGPEPPAIQSINVNQRRGVIQITASGANSIQWISDGNVVHEGSSINLNELEDLGSYVRAVAHGEGNTITGTQPFGIVKR